MTASTRRLTMKQIRLIKPGRYHDGRGLYLQVRSKTARSWFLRYELDGREHWLGLGGADDVPLAEARDLADAARRQVKRGVCPLEARRRERAAQQQAQAAQAAQTMTFKAAAEAYFQAHADKWTNTKHRAQFLSTLQDHAFLEIGNLPVAEIRTPHVLAVLEKDRFWWIKPETADRVRRRIEWVLNWADWRGYRSGKNPARWHGHLEHQLPPRNKIAKPQPHAALPYAQVAGFMTALAGRPSVAARALEFLILTAARTRMVTGATWQEFDLTAGVWTIPAKRMRAGKAHRVPLSAKALAILNALPREADYVFPGWRQGAPISNMTMAQVLRRMGPQWKDAKSGKPITVHGFRSMFRDWAAEATTHPEVYEKALAHSIEDAYLRSDLFDKRRQLMADWSDYCFPRTRDANSAQPGDAARPVLIVSPAGEGGAAQADSSVSAEGPEARHND
jgi:integrase